MGGFVKVAAIGEIKSGSGKLVDVGGKEIALFNVDGTFYAMDNTCPHRGGALAEGSLDGNVVACPWHGWQFDVTTGECLTNPAAQQTQYQIKLEGDDILISA